jgi:3-hydroxybutyryl-CoA dehydrogenase
MEFSEIRRVLVVGAGQMGQGIAHVAALAGYDVTLADVDAARADLGKSSVLERLAQLVAKGKLTAEAAELAGARLEAGDVALAALAADVVIEAVAERLEVKLALFEALDHLCPPRALLLSNTSAISITRLAAATRRPAKVAGMHFMNPVPVMRLVEVVRAVQTSDATLTLVRQLAEHLGKTVVVSSDRPGFIVNRVLIPLLNEACFALEGGVASAEDIDQAVQLGLNHPLGPLHLADLIGLDTVLAISEVLHRDLGEDKYRPSVTLRNLVSAGYLGRKTGRGFFSYGEP